MFGLVFNQVYSSDIMASSVASLYFSNSAVILASDTFLDSTKKHPYHKGIIGYCKFFPSKKIKKNISIVIITNHTATFNEYRMLFLKQRFIYFFLIMNKI